MKRAVAIWRHSLSVLWRNLWAFLLASVAFMAGGFFILPLAPLLFGIFMMAETAVAGGKPGARDVFSGFSHFTTAWAFGLILLASSFSIFAVVTGAIVWGASPMTATLAFMAASFFMGTVSLVVFCAIPLCIGGDMGVLASVRDAGGLVKERFWTAVLLAALVVIMQALFSATILGIGLSYAFGAIAFTLFARD